MQQERATEWLAGHDMLGLPDGEPFRAREWEGARQHLLMELWRDLDRERRFDADPRESLMTDNEPISAAIAEVIKNLEEAQPDQEWSASCCHMSYWIKKEAG